MTKPSNPNKPIGIHGMPLMSSFDGHPASPFPAEIAEGAVDCGVEPVLEATLKPGQAITLALAAKMKMSPMFEQYLGIKADYPDSILLYRMGDFFELFFDDAVLVARELQLTLTSRNPGAENPIPMCGVPHHALDAYTQQLLGKGYSLVICDQIENPKEAKGLVKRAVTRILTPGTSVDEYNLAAKEHNYLCALFWDMGKGSGGLAWVENSTGEWSGIHSSKEQELWQWLQKLGPRELLLPDLAPDKFRVPSSANLEGIHTLRVPFKSFFERKTALERLLKSQGAAEAAALGLDGKDELVMALGAILQYLSHTQRQEPLHLSAFTPMNTSRYLAIDEISERNLEIFQRTDGKKGLGTLRYALDNTITPMGGRLLEERLRQPWRELGVIEENHNAVEYFVKSSSARKNLRAVLQKVYDLERLSTRIALDNASTRDFTALRQSLSALPSLRDSLFGDVLADEGRYPTADDENGRNMPACMQGMLGGWDNLEDYARKLNESLVDNPPSSITEGGLFRQGYNAELDELIDLAEHGEQRLKELLAKEQQETGLAKLKLGYNRVFGYFFELTKSNQLADSAMPEHFIRRQTLANAERFTTVELKELDAKLLASVEKRANMEYALLQSLRSDLALARPRLIFMAHVIASLDYWQSLAEGAVRNKWNRPLLHKGLEISIREGRHPVVESVQGQGGFIPNDLRMDEKRRMLIITGPNMAGKSTVLRQTAIICLMAQMGSFVPATEAYIGVTDRIFSRVGASDNLSQGQSTFMVEMMETARILRQASKRSLVILDEIGRGTSTFDGLALAWAVVEDLVRRAEGQVRTIFATHYHELTALEGRLDGVHNMNIAIKEWNGEIVFLRRLVPGSSDRSYGIEVARLAGVPSPVVQRAKQILQLLEQNRSQSALGGLVASIESQLPLLSGFEGMKLRGGGENSANSKEKVSPLLPELTVQVKHPLLTVLQDLDVNQITPFKALEILSEWKNLWGDGRNEDEK